MNDSEPFSKRVPPDCEEKKNHAKKLPVNFAVRLPQALVSKRVTIQLIQFSKRDLI